MDECHSKSVAKRFERQYIVGSRSTSVYITALDFAMFGFFIVPFAIGLFGLEEGGNGLADTGDSCGRTWPIYVRFLGRAPKII